MSFLLVNEKGVDQGDVALRIVLLACLLLIVLSIASLLAGNQGMSFLSWGSAPGINSTLKSQLLLRGKI